MSAVFATEVKSSSGTRTGVLRTVRRISGAAVWHGVMIVACAFVLVPIVMVVLGSFKSVSEFFASPYGLPESFGLHKY